MKPLRISMTAFGPFVKTEKVDFKDYQGNLFLIYGPTGSGKTTIFDAMCYALYGTTSGDMKTGKQMCCNLPNASAITEVTFDFEIGDTSYRVVRRPEQTKPKANGNGTTKVLHAAMVYELASAAAEDATDDGLLLVSRPRDVSEKIHELLGFEAAQFRQVVLIPQGDFRQLLTANSVEREKILKVLFNTDVYSQIQDALGKRISTLNKSCAKVAAGRDERLRLVGAVNVEEVEELIMEREAEGKELKIQAAKANDRFQKIQDKFSKVKSVHDRFVELDEANVQKSELAGEQDKIAQLKNEVKFAKRAKGLIDIASAKQEKEIALEKASEKKDKAAEKLESARENAKLAQMEKVKSDKRKDDLETMASKIDAHLKMLPVVEKLAKDQAVITEQQEQLASLVESQEKAESQADELAVTIANDEAELKRVQKLAGNAGELELRVKNAADLLDDRELLDAKARDLKDETATCKAAKSAEEEARKTRTKLEGELRQTEKDWEASRVHVIAEFLENDVPCPVCGSTEHPEPAKPSDSTRVVNDSKLTKARKAEQDSSKQLKMCEKDRVAVEGRVDAIEKEVKRLKKKKGVTDTTAAALRKDAKDVNRQLTAALSAESDIEQLEIALKANDQLRSEYASDVKSRETSIQGMEIKTAKLKATLQQKLEDVPKKLQDLAVLLETSDELKKRRTLLAALIAGNDKCATSTETAKAVAETNEKSAVQGFNRASDGLSKSAKILADRLMDAGFKSTGEMEDALREENVLAALEIDKKDFRKRKAAVNDRLKRAKSLTKDKKRPDLHKISENLSVAQQEKDAALKAQSGNQKDTKRLKDDHQRIQELSKKIEKQDGELSVFKKLEQVAKGNLPGTENLSLQRYVLAGFLDDVTAAATYRLRKMSKGRYQLHRSLTTQNKRATAGLDLDVLDDFTGESRTVKTLSGGEMFLASLSLALGLSDVVQSYAGGVHLDSLFIDEGFGSLDSATLDDAIETLMELNQGGRMVGVISHVNELKERIDKKIEVKCTPNGSTVVF